MNKQVTSLIVSVLLAITGGMPMAFAATGTTFSTMVAGESGESRSIKFTWTFHSGGGPAQYGQFANGDYWIAPAAGQTSVTITAITGAGSGQIYADENPQIEAMGLLSKDYGNLNTNENIIPKLPLTYNYATSLVAVIQRDEAQFGNCGTAAIVGCCADAYNVVTVLTQVPHNNGADVLRPNIVRAQKDLLTWDDLDLTRLPSVSYLAGTDSATLEGIRKVWSHHVEVLAMRDTAGNGFSEGGRAFRADLVTDDYAATVARSWHSHFMLLAATAVPLEQKRAALAAMLTYGKDIFYQVYTPAGVRDRWFGCGAGQSLGRFPAAVFFAALVRDSLYGQALQQASTTQINIGGAKSVHELDQINLGHNGPIWGDGDEFNDQYEVGRYWGEVLMNQSFNGASGNFPGENSGQRTSRDPYLYIDGPGIGPLSAYGSLTAGPIRAFAAETYLMPQMCDIVNYDALTIYANRLTATGKLTAPDPCAPPDPRENPDSCDAYRCQGCKYYGLRNTGTPTWGPDPDSVAAGNWTACIRNHLDPLSGQMQTGRYSQQHGTAITVGYSVSRVEGNWNRIRDGRSVCTRTVPVRDAAPRPAAPRPVSFDAHPNPSTGFVYFTGPASQFLVFDRFGAPVGAYKSYAILKEGLYFVTTPDRAAVRSLIIIQK
jgi:hypothetical protein